MLGERVDMMLVYSLEDAVCFGREVVSDEDVLIGGCRECWGGGWI